MFSYKGLPSKSVGGSKKNKKTEQHTVWYRIFFYYPDIHQDRALLKVGRCMETEIAPFNTPT